MALKRQAASRSSEHLILDLAQLDQKFAVGRVFGGVSASLRWIAVWVVQLRPHLSGKEKGPTYADRACAIQLVCIKEDLRLKALWSLAATEAVRSDGRADSSSLDLAVAQTPQDRLCQFRTASGVADGAADGVAGAGVASGSFTVTAAMRL